MNVRNQRFTVELPRGWEDRSVFTFWGPEEDGVQHVVSITIEDAQGRSAQQLAQERSPTLVGTKPEAEVLRQGAVELGEEADAHEVASRIRSNENTPLIEREVYVVQGGKGCAFTGRFTKRTIKTQGVLFSRMIESFRFED